MVNRFQCMSLYHLYDKHKQTIWLKIWTYLSQVERSTSVPMGKEGMIRDFDSFDL